MDRDAIIYKSNYLKDRGFIIHENMMKTNEQIKQIRDSSKISASLLDLISQNIKEGISTKEIEAIDLKSIIHIINGYSY